MTENNDLKRLLILSVCVVSVLVIAITSYNNLRQPSEDSFTFSNLTQEEKQSVRDINIRRNCLTVIRAKDAPDDMVGFCNAFFGKMKKEEQRKESLSHENFYDNFRTYLGGDLK